MLTLLFETPMGFYQDVQYSSLQLKIEHNFCFIGQSFHFVSDVVPLMTHEERSAPLRSWGTSSVAWWEPKGAQERMRRRKVRALRNSMAVSGCIGSSLGPGEGRCGNLDVIGPHNLMVSSTIRR